jgi:hypothetical protein
VRHVTIYHFSSSCLFDYYRQHFLESGACEKSRIVHRRSVRTILLPVLPRCLSGNVRQWEGNEDEAREQTNANRKEVHGT